MILWNSAPTRDALRRALDNLDRYNDGAVMDLEMVGGDVQLALISDRPLTESEAYVVRFAT